MRVISDVACTVCGCVCDDLTVTVDGGRIVQADGACFLAEPWFLSQNAAAPPAAAVDGRPATFDEAVGRAAGLLAAARSPLVYGLSRSTTEGQRAAAALADRIGATIDTTASTGHAPSILALQQVGESTCTLGEVRNRADLVVYWGSDPAVTHPRHRERYAPPRPGRFVVVADVRETESARSADLFLPVEPGRDWEALWALRLLVRGREPRPGAAVGVPLDLLRSLAGRMKACRFGIVFFGAGLTRGRNAHRTVEALLQLVTDLNDFTRFYARRMRRYGDVAGADSVLAWQTGYPFGVNLARGYPRYNPGEFTGPDLLARGEVDCCVLVGSETAADFPPVALDRLRAIPVVALDPPGAAPPVPAEVRFTTAVYGVHRPGTAYRMDEVPIPLRVLLPTDYPSDGEVLDAVLRRLSPGTEPPTHVS
jgi:formylmethanofuran dehydrogenase subunit B